MHIELVDLGPTMELIQDLSLQSLFIVLNVSVIQRKRDLKNGVRVSDDLIWKDRQKKKKLHDVMKQAYDEGKKPRFRHSNLYIVCVPYKSGS